MAEAVIVSSARTPIGRAFKGSLKDMRPDDLLAAIIADAVAKADGVTPEMITDVLVGCGQPGGESGWNVAKAAISQIGADWDQVPGVTVNRYCSSSLMTSRMAMHAIKAGEGDVFISAGVETVSRYGNGKADGDPEARNDLYADAIARTAKRAEGGASMWVDPREEGSLPDIYIGMGDTAENVAQLRGVSRERQDEFAAASQQKAQAAIEAGVFEREITPITLADGTVVSTDDGPRPGTTVEKLAGLKPVFWPDGSVTAGNACPLNDGAAALVIMSDEKAKALGLQPLARIVATGVSSVSPEIMGLGPVEACKRTLAQAGMSINDIDLVEINEAFAAQAIPCIDDLGGDFDKVNVHGGAIALGHPFGMTGARITHTLLNALQTKDKQFGLETMCVAGGQGMAMIIERLK